MSRVKDVLGDRMKEYEALESGRKFMSGLPIVARIDGRTFSNFTRGMGRPFDQLMQNAMIETTKALVKETHACMGYTQSDEITLIFNPNTKKSQIWFNARVTKMTSQLAAQATLFFYKEIEKHMPKYKARNPTFDARANSVPSMEEAANSLLWRERDATKNSITMAASQFYSHKQLMGKSGKERQEMLFQKGVNWNDYPASFKRGTFVQKVTTSKTYTAQEIAKLAANHPARKDPDLVMLRSGIEAIEMPRFGTLKNPIQVIFNSAKPIVGDLQMSDEEGFVTKNILMFEAA